jgi:cytochrome c556
MGTIVPDLFPAGSAGGKAKDELWQNSADFQKLMNDMKSKTAALSAAAAKGESFDALKPLFGAAGGSCKACHDKYKAD